MEEDNLFNLSNEILKVINNYNLTNHDFAIMYVKGSISIIDLESDGIKEAMQKRNENITEQNSTDEVTESESLQEK